MLQQTVPTGTARRSAEPLTEARVAKATPLDKRWVLADATMRGLVVRIEPSGAKSYFVRARIGKGRKAPWAEIRLGDTDQLRLSEARDIARGHLFEMRSGKDPRRATLGEMECSEVLRRYSIRLEQRGVVKRKEAIRNLEVNLSRHSSRQIGELSRPDIIAEIERIEAKGLFGAAEDFRKHCVAMLNWAVSAGVLTASPMAGYRRERSTRARRLARPTVVFQTKDDIRSAWIAFDAEADPWFSAFLKFLLLTGQRRTETSLARWADFEFEGKVGIWSIPPEVRKMGDGHRVPLGSLSQSVLQSLQRSASDLVFPGRAGAPMSGWTKRLRTVKSKLKVDGFAFHALRRTYRTGLSDLGVPFEIAELMIGHTRPDLVRRYDYAALWDERCRAQVKWEHYISGVTS